MDIWVSGATFQASLYNTISLNITCHANVSIQNDLDLEGWQKWGDDYHSDQRIDTSLLLYVDCGWYGALIASSLCCDAAIDSLAIVFKLLIK